MVLVRNWKKILGWSALALVALALAFVLIYAQLFGPADKTAGTEQFFITPEDTIDTVATRLKYEHFVRSDIAVRIALLEVATKGLHPGGYTISASMDTLTVAGILGEPPYLAWIKIPRGYRKEQIATLLTRELGWSDAQKEEWINSFKGTSFYEGIFFPTTYLIPTEEAPARVAERMKQKFSDTYALLVEKSAKRSTPWPEIVIIASLIDREAAGPEDVKLISGVIWNRLAKKMPLGIDATLQYIKGTEENWWPVVHGEDKYLESAFNTYFKSGLPPHPIDNPNTLALEAALNPATTTCLYYLHDYKGKIHCSNTYKGHVANVNKYLK